MQTYFIHSYALAKEGRQAELEAWYDDQHIPDTLKLEGFVAAQRYRITQGPEGAPTPAWTVLVVYEVVTDDLRRTLSTMRKAAGTEAMPLTDALDLRAVIRVIAEPAAARATAGASGE